MLSKNNYIEKYGVAFGNILSIVSIAYIFYLYKQSTGPFGSSSTALAKPQAIIIGIFLFAISNTIAAEAWRRINNVLHGTYLPPARAFSIWMHSNLAKYLPGNVFHYIGRYTLSRGEGIDSRQAYSSLILEVGLIIGAALSVTIVGLLTHNIPISFGEYNLLELSHRLSTIPWGFVVTTVAILLALGSMISKSLRYTLSIGFNLVLPYLHYILTFVIAGFATLTILTDSLIFDSEHTLLELTSVYSIAFLIGFLLPGAPGGIGVREAALVTFMSPGVGIALAIKLAVTLRLCTLAADLTTGLIAITFFRGNSLKMNKNS